MTPKGRGLTVSCMRRSHDPKIEALAAIGMLSHCPLSELALLAESADETTLPAGHVLMREGEPGAEAFVVLAGEAEVVICGQVIASVRPGESVGEMALIDGGPRTATVVAKTPLTVLVVGRRHASALLDQPGVARGLLEVLSTRLRDADADPAVIRMPASVG